MRAPTAVILGVAGAAVAAAGLAAWPHRAIVPGNMRRAAAVTAAPWSAGSSNATAGPTAADEGDVQVQGPGATRSDVNHRPSNPRPPAATRPRTIRPSPTTPPVPQRRGPSPHPRAPASDAPVPAAAPERGSVPPQPQTLESSKPAAPAAAAPGSGSVDNSSAASGNTPGGAGTGHAGSAGDAGAPAAGTAGAGTPAVPSSARIPRMTPPRVIATAGMEYPGDAFRLTVRRQDLGSALAVEGTEGTVAIRALVSAGGEVRTVEVTASSGVAALDRAAADAVRRWRFAPATRDGAPIDAYVTFKIRYVVR